MRYEIALALCALSLVNCLPVEAQQNYQAMAAYYRRMQQQQQAAASGGMAVYQEGMVRALHPAFMPQQSPPSYGGVSGMMQGMGLGLSSGDTPSGVSGMMQGMGLGLPYGATPTAGGIQPLGGVIQPPYQGPFIGGPGPGNPGNDATQARGVGSSIPSGYVDGNGSDTGGGGREAPGGASSDARGGSPADQGTTTTTPGGQSGPVEHAGPAEPVAPAEHPGSFPSSAALPPKVVSPLSTAAPPSDNLKSNHQASQSGKPGWPDNGGKETHSNSTWFNSTGMGSTTPKPGARGTTTAHSIPGNSRGWPGAFRSPRESATTGDTTRNWTSMNASSTVQPSNIPGHERLPAAAPGVPNGTPGESKRDMPASRKEWVNLFQKIPETAFLPQFTDKGSGNLSRSATPRLPRP